MSKGMKTPPIDLDAPWCFVESIGQREGDRLKISARFVLRGTFHQAGCTGNCVAAGCAPIDRVVRYYIPLGEYDASFRAVSLILNSRRDPAEFEGLEL